jgi:hypothetical protein
MRYEVTHYPPRPDAAEPIVTDAAGVTDLVHQAALTGTRVHVRPISDPAEPPPEPQTP